MAMMMHISKAGLWRAVCLCICMLLCSTESQAQPPLKKYSLREGREVIELSKDLPVKDLADFIRNFSLEDLHLPDFLKTGMADSLKKRGWYVLVNAPSMVVLERALFGVDLNDMLFEKFVAGSFPFGAESQSPTLGSFGNNRFKNKYPFRLEDSLVVFYLKDHKEAGKVLLAGSFSNWQQSPLPMQRTDSGWIAFVKLPAGKHWYKFIVDGNWTTDAHNLNSESDAEGNINSVYYRENQRFVLNGFTDARKVYLSGSFNNWNEKELSLNRTAQGWELPLMLPEGTHTYKFIVDGEWLSDPENKQRLPDGHGGYNSVLRIGSPYIFRLHGFEKAERVFVTGSFNGWKDDELAMQRTADGWELPHVLGAGNYEYKFVVDGAWIADPANAATGDDGNSFMVVAPNHTFRLKLAGAKRVYVSGDFNGWSPVTAPMKKEGDEWTFQVFLGNGKHRYKFIVDGEWILDPANKLWEENEYGTGNSIIWMSR